MNTVVKDRIDNIIDELEAIKEFENPSENVEFFSYEDFMSELKAIRKKLKLTKSEIAKLIYVNPATISLWENGSHQPRVMDVFSLVDALGYKLIMIPKGEEA